MPLTRRRFLAGSLRVLGGGTALVAASACDPLGRSGPRPRRSPSPGPDPLLELLAAERALLSQYDVVLARFPAAPGAAAVRADHAAHVDALRALVHAPAAASPAPVSPPGTTAAAVAMLRAAETSAAARATDACLAAPAARAALLGSIAACETAHLVLLR
ncbi:MAG: hypothetical protein DLM59_08595 [Pseudonocardiales bacterium]|nr:MAG: hypothetical protein DLM59_08595 [Pseudonocardiales bacterium]